MAIPKTVQDQFNAQMTREFYSSHLYLAMAAWFESKNLPGFAHWMKVQAEEERSHALKFYKHVVDRGGRVTLDKIDKPQVEWESPLAAFEQTLKHEQEITANVNALVDTSMAQKDHAASSFLKFFVDEQVEEEAQVEVIVNQLRMIGSSAGNLFYIDKHLAKRAG